VCFRRNVLIAFCISKEAFRVAHFPHFARSEQKCAFSIPSRSCACSFPPFIWLLISKSNSCAGALALWENKTRHCCVPSLDLFIFGARDGGASRLVYHAVDWPRKVAFDALFRSFSPALLFSQRNSKKHTPLRSKTKRAFAFAAMVFAVRAARVIRRGR
jgi:hypothetical protein